MKILDSKFKIIWVSIILFLMACSVYGQAVEKQKLTAKDYGLWGTLKNEAISAKGKWVSYSMTYESGLDTLLVQNAKSGQRFSFPQGNRGSFAGDRFFGCLLPDSTFVWCDLETGTLRKEPEVDDYRFVGIGGSILVHKLHPNSNSLLLVLDHKGNVVQSIVGIQNYTVTATSVAYAQCHNEVYSVGILHFDTPLRIDEVTQSSTVSFSNLVWANDGKQLLFLSGLTTDRSRSDTIWFYRVGERQLFSYATTSAINFPRSMVLDSDNSGSLAVSKDGQRVFFMIKNSLPVEDLSDGKAVQVWNSSDPDLFLFRQRYGHQEDRSRLACWWPQIGRFLAIGTKEYPSAFLTGNQDYALVYNPAMHQPTTKYNPDRDYYLLDLETGAQAPFLTAQSESRENLLCSPGGKYIAYFVGGNWWVYSLASKIHTNITVLLPVVFYDEENDQYEESRPYGTLGWTAADDSLLLYDRYDVWQLSPNGKEAHCLTPGRIDRITYRIVPTLSSDMPPSAYYYIDNYYDLGIPIVLQTTGDGTSKTGYCLFSAQGILTPIVYETGLFSGLLSSKYDTIYTFLKEDYDCSPHLLLYNLLPKVKKMIFKSNRHGRRYGWGKSELVSYITSKGKVLQGVLFYPFDYDPKQQYPVIVSIYERQRHVLHSYMNPSMLNASGFNKTNFTSSGYFVFYPDIVYEVGQPGFSAVDCVVAGVKKVLELASIDRNRVGLIGHSYGGYETNFIITQTDFFKAAVSGSSVSDLTSGYFSLSWSYAKTDYWRYENAQLRLGKSFYEDMDCYRTNSPITYAGKITTPLLLWTGEKDRQVNPFQTMELYMAMRKLKKSNVMLVYPNEGHVLLEEKNQIDLSTRIEDWFNYYLK